LSSTAGSRPNAGRANFGRIISITRRAQRKKSLGRSTMKSRTISIAAIAALLTGFLHVPQRLDGKTAPSAAGFVAGIRGKAYIIRNKNTIMISGMDLLYPGDSVRVSKGSTARITMCGNRGYEIRGGASLIIRASGIAFRHGRPYKTYAVVKKACIAALDVFKKNERKLPVMIAAADRGALSLRSRLQNERFSVYVLRGRKRPPSIELYGDRLMPRKPFVVWAPVEKAASYNVVLMEGDKAIWKAVMRKNSFVYPEGAPHLEEGREYGISIEAVSEQGDVLARGSGTLSLFSKEELESLKHEESAIMALYPDKAPERQILLGKLYEAHGQPALALTCYESALSLDRGNVGLKERIMLLKNLLK
jgi:hypothetical protein